MIQFSKTDDLDSHSLTDIDSVIVENPMSPDECILYTQEASCRELKEMWISADGDSYIAVEDTQ